MTTTRYAPISAATAIAVVLALSSTASLAQEAQPTTTDPTPPATTTVPSQAPDTAPAEAAAPAATDTPASVTTRTVKQVKHTTHVVAAKPAPVVTHKTTQTVTTTKAAVPAAAAPAVAAAASPPAPNAPAKLNPIVDMKAKPTKAPTQAPRPAQNVDQTTMIAGGGALALLALGGGAYALVRRRRRRDEEAMLANQTGVDEPGTMGRHDPIFEHEPPMIAPSAFAWGKAESTDHQAATLTDDREPGETWVERAHRGPSADNPSLSLRKRLKRAAFFDKRDREVAAGMAKPVEADAGLPENVAEPAGASSTHERELEAA